MIGGIITWFLTGNWKLSLGSAILVFVIVLMNNPKRRYMKAFWVVLSMILILNKFYFDIAGKISGIDFKVGANKVGNSVTICLIILAVVCLILDYLERNGKLEGTFLSVKKNRVGDINGNGNTINQTNV